MPSSKTDTATRFPASDDQKRRAWTTQDNKAAAKSQSERSSGKNKSQDSTTWSPEQMLASHMDEAGNPVPDPITFSDGAKAKKMGSMTDEADVFEAMNAETADFD